MKLDDLDREILALLDQNCRVPITDLGKSLMKSRQTIEYRINRMVREGLITSFNTAFNPHKLGFKVNKLYLKLRNVPAERQALLERVRSSQRVWWIGESSGNWDLTVAFFCRTDYEFFELKNEIIGEHNRIIVETKIETLVDVHQFTKMYFTGEIGSWSLFGGDVVDPELTEWEYGLLRAIVNNARVPITSLAEQLEVSPTFVRNKLAKLEDLGIIIQYRIGVDISKLGLDLYKTIVVLDRYSKSDEEALLSYVSRIPNMQYLIKNLSDIELEMVVRDYQEHFEIVEDLKKQFPYVIRSVDSVLMLTDDWTPGFGSRDRKSQ